MANAAQVAKLAASQRPAAKQAAKAANVLANAALAAKLVHAGRPHASDVRLSPSDF